MILKTKLADMKVLEEGAIFRVLFDPAIDAVQSYIEGNPNYFILNKNTGRVEGHAMSEYMARKSLEAAEDLYAGKEPDLSAFEEEFTH